MNHFNIANNESWYIVDHITFFTITFKIIIHYNNYLEYSIYICIQGVPWQLINILGERGWNFELKVPLLILVNSNLSSY